MVSSNNIHKDLLIAQAFLSDKCGFACTRPIAEGESADYAAYTFKISTLSVIYRESKITPTKTGQFVTLWKRTKNGPIQPFGMSDEIDIFIIASRKDNRLGLFIFPKAILHNMGVLSDNSNDGKRAIRVYPPWDITMSKQAQKTQHWQLTYFLEISDANLIDLDLAKKLLLFPE